MVKLTDPDFKAKFLELESGARYELEWGDPSLHDPVWCNCVGCALAAPAVSTPGNRGCRVIYGLGGWNRYFYRFDTGEVEFSLRHGHGDSAKLAEALGFKIFR